MAENIHILLEKIEKLENGFSQINQWDKPKMGFQHYNIAQTYGSLYDISPEDQYIEQYAKNMIQSVKTSNNHAVLKLAFAIKNKQTSKQIALIEHAEKRNINTDIESAGNMIVCSMFFRSGSAAYSLHSAIENKSDETKFMLDAMKKKDIAINSKNSKRLLLSSVMAGFGIASAKLITGNQRNKAPNHCIFEELMANKKITKNQFDQWCYASAKKYSKFNLDINEIAYINAKEIKKIKMISKHQAKEIQDSLISELNVRSKKPASNRL